MTLEQDTRFAAALEACCRRVQHGEEIDRCLADYPVEYRSELARLVPQVIPISRLAAAPSPAFQARLERSLLASADQARRLQPSGRLGWVGRFVKLVPATSLVGIFLVVVLVLIGSGVGAVRASDDSLPDSPLYHVKTAREEIELALARGGSAQVETRARQIAERGRELELAGEKRKPARVVEALAIRLAVAIDRMVDQAIDLRAAGNPRPALRAQAALNTMNRRLDRLILQASPEVRVPLMRLEEFLNQQMRRLTSEPAIRGQ